MLNNRRCLTTPKNAKDYLAQNEIPQIFECIMTGLMYHRPPNHIEYIQTCLDHIKQQGVTGVRWNMFLNSKQTILPPIAPNCKEQVVSERDNKWLVAAAAGLPYDCVLVFVIAGPGLSKHDLVSGLSGCFPRFQFVQMGPLIRDKCTTESNKNSAKWKVAASLLDNGELIPDELALEVLIRELNHHPSADVSGFIIEGYPRSQRQLELLEKAVGLSRLRFALLIDCEEETCRENLLNRAFPRLMDSTVVARKIANFKAYSLPVCKQLEDHNKLKIIDGDRTPEEIEKDIRKLFRAEMSEFEEYVRQSGLGKTAQKLPPHLPMATIPVGEVSQLHNVATEISRPDDLLPQRPFVLLIGGPGSGKTDLASHLCALYPGWRTIDVHNIIRTRIFDKGVHTKNWDCIATLSTLDNVHKQANQLVVEHWNITIDCLKEQLKKLSPKTKGVIFEGFPKDAVQLNQLFSSIGGVQLVILIDCDEASMIRRLIDRSEKLQRPEDDLENVTRRISYYKKFTLSLCRYFDEKGRLNIVKGDKKFSDVSVNLVNVFEAAIMKKKCQ